MALRFRTPSERQEMLAAIGTRSIEELFSNLFRKNSGCARRWIFPARFLNPRSSNFPGARRGKFRGYVSFLGAGVYQHLRSVAADALILRGEFLTSYTPYQAESRKARSPPFSNSKL